MDVQKGPIKKLPHGCPKWGGGSRPLLDNVEKKDVFFYAFPKSSFIPKYVNFSLLSFTLCIPKYVQCSVQCEMGNIQFP